MSSVLLKTTGVSRSFGALQALSEVSIELAEGEAVGLVGENGAGKSTLIKILSGAESADRGRIEFRGEDVDFRDPRSAQAAGISTVHQRNWLIGSMTALQNVELCRESVVRPLGWLRRSPAPAALNALGLVGLRDRAATTVSSLSLADRQLVAVARAVATGGRLMILDEPTAALSAAETRYLFETIGRVREAGMAMIYVSHRLEEFRETVDRIFVLRDGQLVATVPPDSSEGQLVELMSGAAVVQHERELAASRHQRLIRNQTQTATPLLEVDALEAPDGAFARISFRLSAGEVVGLVGLPDSGVDRLTEVIAGAGRPSSGQIRIEGRALGRMSPRRAIRRRIGYLPGDRANRGVIPNASVRTSTTLSALGRVGRFGVISRGRERALSNELLESCRVRAADPGMPITALSGGNQQKALLARVLAIQPKVLVVQEPTAGVDVAGRESLYELISSFCLSGGGVIWSSSDLREVETVSDRVLALFRGEIVAELQKEDLHASSLMAAQFNVTEDEVIKAMHGNIAGRGEKD